MNNYNKAGMVLVCTSTLLFSSTSFAAEPGFSGSLATSYTTDDNVFREVNGVSDSIFTVSPDLLFVNAFGNKHQLSTSYKGVYAMYGKNTKEDYNDHFVNLDLLLDLSKKVNVNLIADYSNGHETRGSSSVSTALDITLLNKNSVFAGIAFGSDTAKMQAELDYKVENVDYTNNAQDSRDRRDSTVSTRVFYNVSGKTKVYVEAKQNTIDYPNSTRDNKEMFYHAGLRWDASAKTTGDLKVGSYDKKFDTTTQYDGDGTSYEANITWSPKTYSVLTLSLSKSPQESAFSNGFYTSELSSLNWGHSFSEKLSLNLNASATTDKYSDGRKDVTSNAVLAMNYKMRRWLDLGLSYTNSKRDSSNNSFDFTDNLVLFTATLIRDSK